jgi:CO dehydrogenase/acetyl-CoA synthase beta subunit
MAKNTQTDNEIIDELIAASTSQDSPVVKEIAEVEEVVVEEAPVVEEVVEQAPEVVEEPAPVVEKPSKKETTEKLTPGMYYQGKRITNITAKLGRKWTVIIDGERVKADRGKIVIVE